jgi:hypothetical protein
MAKKLQKSIKIVFLFFLVFLVAAPYAKALDQKAEIKVYQRFFKATGAESQYDQIVNLMVAQFQQEFSPAIRELAKKMGDATPEEKEKVRQLIEQAIKNYFPKMKVKITSVMPWNELITNVYYPAFSKQFTVSEVEEITKFYESPIGKKYVSAMPTIMQESLTLINQKYAPQLQKISSKLIEEEMKKINQEAENIQKKH